jgi:hypothetical protein
MVLQERIVVAVYDEDVRRIRAKIMALDGGG